MKNTDCGGSGGAAIIPLPFDKLNLALGLEDEVYECLESECEFMNAMYDFLNRNIDSDGNYDEDAKAFAKAAALELGSGTECNLDFEVDWELSNINNLTNPCAREIFNELEDGIYTDHPISPEVSVPNTDILDMNFTEYILSLFNESQFLNYTIENGTPDNPDANASTTNTTTVLNNSYLSTATQLSIARTMIHELVHAYLNYRYGSPLSFDNGLDFKLKMEQYAIDNGISNVTSNEFHHEFMGQYINAMAYSLYQWDRDYGTGGDLGWDYYYAMAFSSQFNIDEDGNISSTSDTFEELVPDASDRQDIINIILNEQNGTNDAQGGQCN